MLGAVPVLKVCSAQGPQWTVGAPKLRLSDVLPLASFIKCDEAPQAGGRSILGQAEPSAPCKS